jgi:hypothetical protein
MMPNSEPGPDEIAFREDIKKVNFLAGEANGYWEIVAISWPEILVWIAAGPRKEAPTRFLVRALCGGYPNRGPTGTLWDREKNSQLANALWPKGRARVAHVFRPNWESGSALYHPFDGLTLEKHRDWPEKYAAKLWTRKHTMADWLAEFHELLNCDEYEGV